VPRFLLATQTFVDFARSATSPVRAWLATARRERGVSDLDLAVGVMSLVSLERHFQDLERAEQFDAQKRALRLRCETLTQEFRHRSGILPFSDDDLAIWAQIQRLAPDLGEEGFVFATAITRRLSLLARPEPIHAQLHPFGLLVEDPYVP
jgi:hypothetical protein